MESLRMKVLKRNVYLLGKLNACPRGHHVQG